MSEPTHPKPTTVQVACLDLKPLAFYGHPLDEALIAHHEGRVVAMRGLHLDTPLEGGDSITAARLKAPHALLLEAHTPALEALWQDLLEFYYGHSLEVESLSIGQALLRLSEDEAWLLAHHQRARIGLGPTRALARVAASLAPEGEVVVVLEQTSFLESCPVGALAVLGVPERLIEHLHLLGVRFVGALLPWSNAQLTAYFGASHRALLELLRGDEARVARYKPRQVIRSALEFEEPLSEPRDLEPAIFDLAQCLLERLQDRNAGRLTLQVTTPLGVITETSVGKLELSTPKVLARAIQRCLERSGAPPLGVTRLEGRLENFTARGELVNLFARPDVSLAVARVHRRYPERIRRYREQNANAEWGEGRFKLEVWHASSTTGR
jgi:protein ImuB